jgi:ABC-type multidrug transport system fused ATPase/permease subunit
MSRDAQLQMARVGRRSSSALGIATLAANMVTLALGSMYVLRGQITVGELLVIQSYISQLFAPLMQSASIIGSLRVQLVGAERVCDVLDRKPAIVSPSGAISRGAVRGDIEFRKVWFSYDSSAPLLQNITFRVAAMEKVAIVGMSGKGKTTILSLIPRLLDPQAGSVLIDDLDVRTLDLWWLRRQIGFVWQDAPIFPGTLEDNIRYGSPTATPEQVAAALAAADLEPLVDRLPRGLQSEVGDNGVRLSTGERLRVAIARALVKQPSILLLDEPTSSLDPVTERKVLQTLSSFSVTSIIVSHRPAPLRYVNRVIEVRDSGDTASFATEICETAFIRTDEGMPAHLA